MVLSHSKEIIKPRVEYLHSKINGGHMHFFCWNFIKQWFENKMFWVGRGSVVNKSVSFSMLYSCQEKHTRQPHQSGHLLLNLLSCRDWPVVFCISTYIQSSQSHKKVHINILPFSATGIINIILGIN